MLLTASPGLKKQSTHQNGSSMGCVPFGVFGITKGFIYLCLLCATYSRICPLQTWIIESRNLLFDK